MKYSIFALLTLLLSSCASYVDVPENSINNNTMVFDYSGNENRLKYVSKVNTSADHDVYYTTHFSITLPKNIVNWNIASNNFFFEYNDKQIFYIYSSYKNEVQTSKNWELKDITHNEVLKYIGEYWDKRKYNENHLYKAHNGRVSKLYTNGKYKILLYNIKTENLQTFIRSAKTFNTNL
ncbi:hypothetical protein MQX03_17000 [Chryseobacterium aahli]|uniref:hypothetical protein n=1 Tax=Chryseobacterium aahli TaxID=1278643 RepID=UPI001F6000D1|nr:hypothetical protein [Chryseobacterium aahli]MCI3938901.1 hypothetical protein [Chryseobacterium aahli]